MIVSSSYSLFFGPWVLNAMFYQMSEPNARSSSDGALSGMGIMAGSAAITESVPTMNEAVATELSRAPTMRLTLASTNLTKEDRKITKELAKASIPAIYRDKEQYVLDDTHHVMVEVIHRRAAGWP
jgi:hypothetical protein